MEEGYGCEISGSIALEKVRGNVHISFHSFMDIYYTLRSTYHDLFMKINLSYEILDLHFGHEDENWKRLQVQQMLSDMDLSEKLFENFVDHDSHEYTNFIGAFWLEMVPYTFIDHRTGLVFKSMQHSFNRKIKVG